MKSRQPLQRIGVLTGGGDCPGLNAVIRAVVQTAIREYGWEVLGIEDGFDGLVQPERVQHLQLDDVRGILDRGGTILGTTNRANPFAYAVATPQGTEVQDVSDTVLHRMRELELAGVVVIGGDGSLRIAHELWKLGAPMVGVPKTIDNDLSATDVTFGFDTAVVTATEALDKLQTTAESHHRVMLLEVMGRDAGWIALHSGIAGGAHIILIPEIPYSLDAICAKIAERERMGRKFTLGVIAEGIAWQGQRIYRASGRRGGASPGLGGVGQCVADAIAERTGRETRCTMLGHLQRGGTPTPFDRILATRFGAAAVHLLARGGTGRMVALHGTTIADVSLAEAVHQQKRVPPDSDLIHTARSLGICLG